MLPPAFSISAKDAPACFSMVSAIILLSSCTLLAAGRTVEPALPGHLQVLIAVSDSPDYIDQWARTSPGKKVAIPQVQEIDLGQPAYVAFIVTGYTLSEHRTPDLEVDVTILQRDGEVFFEQDSYATVKGGPAPPRGLLMADPTLEMDLQEDDLPGTYAITAVVRDKISGKKAQSGFALLAREPEAPEDAGKDGSGKKDGPGKEKKPPR